MVENLEAFDVGQRRFYAVTRLKLERVCVFDKEQQQAVVFGFVANAPMVKQFRPEIGRLLISDAVEADEEHVGCVADGTQHCVDFHLGFLRKIVVRVANMDAVALQSGVRNHLDGPGVLGDDREHRESKE
jgi:hypothetical protein